MYCKAIFVATVVSLLTACGKEKNQPTAVISGDVQVKDEFGQLVAEQSGIQVSSSSGSTITDGSGHYELKTKPGAQTLVFEKRYLGTYKRLDYQVKATEQLPLLTLGRQPVRGVLSVVVKFTSNAVLVQGLMADITPQGLPARRHRLFFNNGPVSATRYLLSTTGETNVGDDQFFDVVTFDQLRAAGLLPGAQIQLQAYTDNPYADTYMNSAEKLTVYPALSPYGSNYVSFSY